MNPFLLWAPAIHHIRLQNFRVHLSCCFLLHLSVLAYWVSTQSYQLCLCLFGSLDSVSLSLYAAGATQKKLRWCGRRLFSWYWATHLMERVTSLLSFRASLWWVPLPLGRPLGAGKDRKGFPWLTEILSSGSCSETISKENRSPTDSTWNLLQR